MKIFLDVGAHIGEVTQVALNAVYGFDAVHCFEPVAECCEALRDITDERVTIHEFGLWDETKEDVIYNPGSNGASVFRNKFLDVRSMQIIQLVNSSDWFTTNIKDTDIVTMKLNCEGAECNIFENLFKTGQHKKIRALLIDFDVRKIPSQKHREQEIRELLQISGIPQIYIVENFDRRKWKRKHAEFTHHWLNAVGDRI